MFEPNVLSIHQFTPFTKYYRNNRSFIERQYCITKKKQLFIYYYCKSLPVITKLTGFLVQAQKNYVPISHIIYMMYLVRSYNYNYETLRSSVRLGSLLSLKRSTTRSLFVDYVCLCRLLLIFLFLSGSRFNSQTRFIKFGIDCCTRFF